MRTPSKPGPYLAIGIPLLLFALVGIAKLDSAAPTDTSSSTPAPQPATTAAVAPPELGPNPANDPDTAAARNEQQGLTTVTRVIDGDTIVVAGDRRVRLLGIDACEMSTQGGKDAKDYLRAQVSPGEQVRLVADGGRDTDRYGRLLRRVERPQAVTSSKGYSGDVGMSMVRYDVVGVYQGRNDAAAAYVDALRDEDDGPRDCTGTPTVPSSAPSGGYSHDDDHDVNMPDGALTGGFCARKWWC